MDSPYQAFEITSRSAALLNDTNKSIFTDSAQLPYLNIALSDLEGKLQLHNVPVTNASSAEIEVTAGDTTIDAPVGLVDIERIWEKPSGVDGAAYTSMTKVTQLPKYLEPTSMLIYFAWIGETISIIGSTQDITVKIEYIKNIFTEVASPDDLIYIINGIDYLSYRTAALCAQFIGENPDRAIILNNEAVDSLDTMLGISSKGKQSISIRRRPFMGSYRRYGSW